MSRELDIAVAERVMGYRIGVIPDYSTDIGAAWRVVEKLNALDWEVTVQVGPGPGACVTLERGHSYVSREASADTASEAICLAALKAAGER